LHNFLQDLHRGSILFGTSGHVLGFLAGISLVFLSISGIIMYFDMLKKRKKAGQKVFFWKTGTGMRRYHRHFSTVAMLFLTYVAVTGTLVSFVQFLDVRAVQSVGGGGMAPEFFGGPSAEERAAMQTQMQPEGGPAGAPAGSGAAPAGPPPEGGPGGPGGPGAGGPPDRGPIVALSSELQKWHKGNIIGEFGQWLVVATGIVFLVLSITGLVMYLQMWSNRKKQGRTGLFWQ